MLKECVFAGLIIACVILIIHMRPCARGPEHIIDNIYLGDWNNSINESWLKNNKIRYILTLNNNKHTANDKQMWSNNSIRNKWIFANDLVSQDIRPVITKSLEYIDIIPSNENILIHCTMGISRSVSVVVAYLMRKGMTFEEALTFVKKLRPIANPNNSFKQSLRSLIFI